MSKPVVAYIAGFTAPAGKQMGHAGAIVSGSSGTAAAKAEALEQRGVRVGQDPHRSRLDRRRGARRRPRRRRLSASAAAARRRLRLVDAGPRQHARRAPARARRAGAPCARSPTRCAELQLATLESAARARAGSRAGRPAGARGHRRRTPAAGGERPASAAGLVEPHQGRIIDEALEAPATRRARRASPARPRRARRRPRRVRRSPPAPQAPPSAAPHPRPGRRRRRSCCAFASASSGRPRS